MKLHQKFFLLLAALLPLQLGRHFWPDWSYVMGLRVDYLSPTVYLTDLLAFLILGLWGLENIKNVKCQNSNVKAKSQISNLAFPILVFVFLLVNCFFAQNQGAAIYKLIKVIEFVLLGFYVVKNADYVSPITYHVLPWAVIYSSLIALGQFLKQSSLGGIFWWLGERNFNAGTPGIAKIEFGGRLLMRPYAIFPHPNALAGFLLVSFILTALFLYQKSKILFTFYFLLFTFSLFLTFSRSVWMVGLLLAFWVLRKIRLNLLLTACCLLFFVFFIYLIKLPNFSQESFSQRLELAKISFQLIKQSSLIGIGLNNFIVHLPEFWRQPILWLQPVHNIYLLVAAETGILGLIIFLWFLFLAYKKIQKMTNPYKSIFLYAYISIFLLGFFDHYWLTLQENQLLLAIVLGLIWSGKNNEIKTNEN